jgi:hypothetical protein
MFYEVSILKTKRCSTGEMLPERCSVGNACTVIYNCTVHYLVQLALQHVNSKTYEVCKVTNKKIFAFLLHIMKPGKYFGQALILL